MSDLLVLLDLEATCWADGELTSIDRHEVIEIGCVLTNFQGVVIDEFQTFVKPINDPQLSPFCMSLTHICQADVDSAPEFAKAMRLLDQWCAGRSKLWSSWGNYDAKMLKSEQKLKGVDSDFMKMIHFNLKRAWRLSSKQRHRTGLGSTLEYLGLPFEGTAHRALDDARNTARILPHIAREKIDLVISEVAT